MNVLFLSSEVAPFSKTGGLADVSSALPKMLARQGHAVTVVSPLYGSIDREGLDPVGQGFDLEFPVAKLEVNLWSTTREGLRYVFLGCDALYDRPGLYGDEQGPYSDNALRFAALSVGGLQAALSLELPVDVVHLNDWQTGLAALALRRAFSATPLGRAKAVFTIHNLAYQGLFGPDWLEELGIPQTLFTSEQLEFHGQLGLMKAGLVFADAITTVSPTYAKEIQGAEAGEGLEGLLRHRSQALHGILNGIDTEVWDPSTDPLLASRFSAAALEGRKANRAALFERFSLGTDDGAPLFVFVTRLVVQKGTDLLLAGIEHLLKQGARVAGVATGNPEVERRLQALAHAHPHQLGLALRHDEPLAHLLEGGGDFLLMPSLYEPCGLSQLYSLRYGCVPIVRRTGGLADTVRDAASPDGTGLLFHEPTPQAFIEVLDRARKLYGQPELHRAVQARGMAAWYGWDASAAEYARLYQSLAGNPPRVDK